jgi:hypothetical protein
MDALWCPERSHPYRHVRRERPDIGVIVDNDPGHHVDHERENAYPNRLVAHDLVSRAQAHLELALMEFRDQAKSVRDRDVVAEEVGHVVTGLDIGR